MLAKGVPLKDIANKLGTTVQYVYSVKYKHTQEEQRRAAVATAIPMPVPTKSVRPRGRPRKPGEIIYIETPNKLPFGIEATPPQPGIFTLLIHKIRQWLMK